MRGTLHHQRGRHRLRFERQFAHRPEKVWRALTDNAELTHWFPAAMHGPREPGARLRFVFQEEVGPKHDAEMSDRIAAAQEAAGKEAGSSEETLGEMIVYDPPRTLEYSWNGEVLRWELIPDGAGTRLVFTHTFDDEAKAARDASGWDLCLESLDHRLDGAPASEVTAAFFDAIFADYAARFGPKASSKRQPGE